MELGLKAKRNYSGYKFLVVTLFSVVEVIMDLDGKSPRRQFRVIKILLSSVAMSKCFQV